MMTGAGLVACYLLGSIPTAYLFGRVLKGIDIRRHGSGNVGATNAFRVLGKGPGAAVLALDTLKGLLALTVVADFFGLVHPIGRVLAGLAVVAGHNWTVFLKFRGGKGIATSFGVLIGLAVEFPGIRLVLLAVILIWAAVFLVSGYVSLSSLTAAVGLPLLMLATGQPAALTVLGVLFAFFVVIRHRSNIGRLLAGTESRVNLPFFRRPFSKRPPASPGDR